MDEWDYVTILRSDGVWHPLDRRRDLEACADLDQLLTVMTAEGWERTDERDTYTGADLSRVHLRHHLLPG